MASRIFCKHRYETIRINEKVYAMEGYELVSKKCHDMMCVKCFKVKLNVKSDKAELFELVNEKKYGKDECNERG